MHNEKNQTNYNYYFFKNEILFRTRRVVHDRRTDGARVCVFIVNTIFKHKQHTDVVASGPESSRGGPLDDDEYSRIHWENTRIWRAFLQRVFSYKAVYVRVFKYFILKRKKLIIIMIKKKKSVCVYYNERDLAEYGPRGREGWGWWARKRKTKNVACTRQQTGPPPVFGKSKTVMFILIRVT